MRRTSPEAAPTMILPQGIRIEMDADGHLSIYAPGNLVVQNSGKYGTLESVGGSIRIDRGVEVEAATVRCADTCFVQGFLVAWKVIARSLQLGDNARAHVVLQETQSLQIGRDARLVGNFSSEKELFGLFSRFAKQVRSLPFLFEKKSESRAELPSMDDTIVIEGKTAEPPPPAGSKVLDPASLPENLLLAMVLLEREAEEGIHRPSSQKALEQILQLLRQQDLETLGFTYRTLFGRISEPREDVRRALELVAQFYSGQAG